MAIPSTYRLSIFEKMIPAISNESAVSQLTYELARSREDLLGAFKLVYAAYLRAGLVLPSQDELRITPYHLLPTTEVIISKLQSTVVSTVSLVRDGELGLPMELMYENQIRQLRSRGFKLAEVGSMADRRSKPSRFLQNFFEMTRVLAQVARQRGVDALVAAVHPRHAKFYRQGLGFKNIGELTTCPYAQDRPAVALCLIFDECRGTANYERYFGHELDISRTEPSERDAETNAILAAAVDQNMLTMDTH